MKLNNSKKAQIGKKIDTAVVLIVSVVVLFLVFAALVPEAQDAGDRLGDAQLCSNAGGFFNTSQSACLNTSSANNTGPFAFESIPINSIFSGTGIVIVLLMVALFLGVLKMVMPGRKK